MLDAGVNPACFHVVTIQLSEVEPAAILPHLVSRPIFFRSWLAKMCEAQKFACDAYLGAPNWGLIRKRRIAVIDSTL